MTRSIAAVFLFLALQPAFSTQQQPRQPATPVPLNPTKKLQGIWDGRAVRLIWGQEGAFPDGGYRVFRQPVAPGGQPDPAKWEEATDEPVRKNGRLPSLKKPVVKRPRGDLQLTPEHHELTTAHTGIWSALGRFFTDSGPFGQEKEFAYQLRDDARIVGETRVTITQTGLLEPISLTVSSDPRPREATDDRPRRPGVLLTWKPVLDKDRTAGGDAIAYDILRRDGSTAERRIHTIMASPSVSRTYPYLRTAVPEIHQIPVQSVPREVIRFRDVTVQHGERYTYRVRAVDLFGRTVESGGAPITYRDPVPPLPPRNVKASIVATPVGPEARAEVTVSWDWDPPEGGASDLAGFVIRGVFPSGGLVDEEKFQPGARSFTRNLAHFPGRYHLYIVAVDKAGNESSVSYFDAKGLRKLRQRPCSGVTFTVPDLIPPSAPAKPTHSIQAGNLHLRWHRVTTPQDDVEGYILSVNDTDLIHVPQPATADVRATLPIPRSGEYKFQVRALDTSDNTSPLSPIQRVVFAPESLSSLMLHPSGGNKATLAWEGAPADSVLLIHRSRMAAAIPAAPDKWEFVGTVKKATNTVVEDFRLFRHAVEFSGSLERRLAIVPLAPKKAKGAVAFMGFGFNFQHNKDWLVAIPGLGKIPLTLGFEDDTELNSVKPLPGSIKWNDDGATLAFDQIAFHDDPIQSVSLNGKLTMTPPGGSGVELPFEGLRFDPAGKMLSSPRIGFTGLVVDGFSFMPSSFSLHRKKVTLVGRVTLGQGSAPAEVIFQDGKFQLNALLFRVNHGTLTLRGDLPYVSDSHQFSGPVAAKLGDFGVEGNVQTTVKADGTIKLEGWALTQKRLAGSPVMAETFTFGATGGFKGTSGVIQPPTGTLTVTLPEILPAGVSLPLELKWANSSPRLKARLNQGILKERLGIDAEVEFQAGPDGLEGHVEADFTVEPFAKAHGTLDFFIGTSPDDWWVKIGTEDDPVEVKILNETRGGWVTVRRSGTSLRVEVGFIYEKEWGNRDGGNFDAYAWVEITVSIDVTIETTSFNVLSATGEFKADGEASASACAWGECVSASVGIETEGSVSYNGGRYSFRGTLEASIDLGCVGSVEKSFEFSFGPVP